MSSEQKELLWRYRYALTKEKKALTKFLICVDWNDKQEAQQAVELIGEWEKQVCLCVSFARSRVEGRIYFVQCSEVCQMIHSACGDLIFVNTVARNGQDSFVLQRDGHHCVAQLRKESNWQLSGSVKSLQESLNAMRDTVKTHDP